MLRKALNDLELFSNPAMPFGDTPLSRTIPIQALKSLSSLVNNSGEMSRLIL